MPNIPIATRFEIEGEKEFTNAIKLINSEYKTLVSSLKLTESEFIGQQNSMDALSKKSSEYEQMLSKLQQRLSEQKQGYEYITSALDKWKQRLDDLKNKSLEELNLSVEEHAKETNNAADAIEKLAARQQTWQSGINNTQTEINKLNSEIAANNKYLDEAKKSTDGTATSIDNYGKEVEKVNPKQQSMNTALESLATILIAAGIQKGFNELVDLLKSTVGAAIEFESAYTGVLKTVEGTPEQLQKISDGIKELSTAIPATTTQIAAVAEAAGQLGIKTDSVLDFTEVMIKLGTTTNLSAEQAASALAKFANITKTNAADYERLGSVIVALGNNFATTESDIVNMATRIASTGEIIGLSEAQIMGIATALSSVGIEAEAGGSAISKVLKNIEVAVATNSGALKDYAKVAGVSAAEFSRAWGEDAVSALSMFIDGLNDTERNGKTAIEILDEMGLTEVRLSNAILALASSEGILNDAVSLSNQAWIDNTALMTEAELRFGTTESKMQLLKNSTDLLKIAIGDQLNPTINGLIDSGDDIVKGLTEWVQANEWVVPSLTALTVGLGVFVGGVTVAMVATKAFTAVLATNPVGAIVVGIVALTAAIATLVITMQDADTPAQNIKKSLDGIKDSLEDSQTAYQDTNKSITDNITKSNEYIDIIEELKDKESLTTIEKYKLKDAIDSLNAIIPGLRLQFDTTNDSVIGYTKSLRELAKAHFDTLGIQAETQYFNSIQTAMVDTQVETIKAEVELEELMEKAKQLGYVTEDGSADMARLMTDNMTTWNQWAHQLGLASEEYNLLYDITEAKKGIADLAKTQETWGVELEASADRLENLNKNLDTTTNISDEFREAVDKYGNVIPKIVDSSKKAAEATTDYTDKLKANANAIKHSEAEQKKIEATYAGSANTVEALSTKIGGLNNTYSKNEERISLLKKAITDETAALDENADSYDENVSKIQAYQTELTNTETAQITLGREIQTMSGYLDEAANSSDGFATSIDETGKLVKDISAATAKAIERDAKAAEKASKDAAKESAKAIEETVKPIDEAFKSIEKSSESLIKSYESARDAAKNSFQSQLDYFRESAEGTELTAKNILDSMTTFTGEAIGYNEDLQRATELGFTDGFVATLTDGGKESKQVLKTILDEYDKLTDGLSADDTKAFVDDFNWAFGQTHKATDALAETVAEMKTGFSDKAQEMLQIASDFGDNLSQYTGEAFDELKNRVNKVMTDLSVLIKPKGEKAVDELKSGIEEKTPDAIEVSETLAAGIIEPIEALEEKGKESGKNFVLGYIEGARLYLYKAAAIGTELADASLNALRAGLDEHSPSRKTYKSGENIVLGYVGGIDDNLWRVDDVMDRMAGSVTSSMKTTEEVIATSQQALVDFYNAATRFEKIDLGQFQNVFKDFSAFQDITETSMQTLDSLVNNIGLDLSTATSEIQRFKDSVYGLDREIITIRDAYGNVFQAGNMPGYMPDPNNPGMAIVNEEYWKEAERISSLAFNTEVGKIYDEMGESIPKAIHKINTAMAELGDSTKQNLKLLKDDLSGLSNTLQEDTLQKSIEFFGENMTDYRDTLEIAKDVWEIGGEAWEVYENHIKQQEAVVDLQKRVNEQFDRLLESGSTDTVNGIVVYNQAALQSYNELIAKLTEAQEALTATTADFDKLGEAIKDGTVGALYGAADAIGEETNIIIRDVMLGAIDMESWGAYAAQMMAEGFTVQLREKETGNLIDAADFFADTIKDTVQDGLGIHSRSKVFEDYGTNSAEAYYHGLIEELNKQLQDFDMNTPELAAKIEEYMYVSSLPAPSLDSIVNNNSVVHENNRTFAPKIYITPQPYQSEYAIARQIIEQERIALYG